MSSQFNATSDFLHSVISLDTLISFAESEESKGNSDNRSLFLRLGIVTLVTKFQVFIERILEEFLFELNNSNILNKELPVHFRINNFKIFFAQKNIQKELENPTTYNINKLSNIQILLSELNTLIEDDLHSKNNNLNTKYPLGKTGLQELRDLFLQIEGVDIFSNAPFDINRINEILGRRHAIIHEDKDMQLTELKLIEYKDFIKSVVQYIDNYLTEKLI